MYIYIYIYMYKEIWSMLSMRSHQTISKCQPKCKSNKATINSSQTGITVLSHRLPWREPPIRGVRSVVVLIELRVVRKLTNYDQINRWCSACVTTQVRNPHCARGTRVCRMELCFILAPYTSNMIPGI